MDPIPDTVLPEKFLGYSRESNPGPLGWQSDVLITIPNRWSLLGHYYYVRIRWYLEQHLVTLYFSYFGVVSQFDTDPYSQTASRAHALSKNISPALFKFLPQTALWTNSYVFLDLYIIFGIRSSAPFPRALGSNHTHSQALSHSPKFSKGTGSTLHHTTWQIKRVWVVSYNAIYLILKSSSYTTRPLLFPRVHSLLTLCSPSLFEKGRFYDIAYSLFHIWSPVWHFQNIYDLVCDEEAPRYFVKSNYLWTLHFRRPRAKNVLSSPWYYLNYIIM